MTRALLCLNLVVFLVVGAGCGSSGSKEAPGLEAGARAGEPVPREPGILLANLRVFDAASGAMTPAQDILIEGGRITAMGPEVTAPEGTDRIDCSGKYAVPGLFDCHTHLSFLTTKGNKETRKILKQFVSNGITQVRDVGGPIDVIAGLSSSVSKGDLTGPEIFYTGPMLEKSPMHWSNFNEELPGFTVGLDTKEDVDRILQELVDNDAGLIKTFNRIDRDVYAHLVETARKHELRIVHDPGMPLFHAIPMDWAIEQGVTSIEHAKAPWPVVLVDDLKERHDALLAEGAEMPAMMELTLEAAERGVESISAGRLERLIDAMLENEVYLCPTLHVFEQMGEERPQEVPPEQWETRRKMRAGMVAVGDHFTSEMSRRGVRFLVGQDGSDPDATLAELAHLRARGVPAAEVLKGATLYPAQWLGVEDRLGSIEPGKEARILVLDSNPLEEIENIRTVFLVVNGAELLE